MAEAVSGIIPRELLDILACPRCRAAVELVSKSSGEQGLVCGPCGVVYPIQEGIPVMLVDEAVPCEKWDGEK
jgi:uncharacterized protein YbaR (Trm112 family)